MQHQEPFKRRDSSLFVFIEQLQCQRVDRHLVVERIYLFCCALDVIVIGRSRAIVVGYTV